MPPAGRRARCEQNIRTSERHSCAVPLSPLPAVFFLHWPRSFTSVVAIQALTALGVQVVDGVDVAEEASIQRMVERLGEETRLDIVINNAGILEVETLDDMNFDTIRRQFGAYRSDCSAERVCWTRFAVSHPDVHVSQVSSMPHRGVPCD